VKHVKHVSLPASNGSSFSPDQNTSVLRFTVPNSIACLRSGSLRLMGDATVTYDGASPAQNEAVQFNNWAGLQSLISQVDIYSLKSGVLLESLKNYGQYMTMKNSAGMGAIDLDYQIYHENRAATGQYFTRVASQASIPFSIELMSGLSHSIDNTPLDLIGGLKIQITLNQNNQFLQKAAALTNQASVALTNVRLTATMVTPTPMWAAKAAESFVKSGAVVPFPSFEVFNSQVTADSQSISKNISYSRLRSLYWSYLTASDSNSATSDSFKLQPKDVTRLALSMDGILKPVKYEISAPSIYSGIIAEAYKVTSAPLARHYLEAVSLSDRPTLDRVYTNIARANFNPSNNAGTPASIQPTFGNGYLIDDEGASFVNSTMQLAIEAASGTFSSNTLLYMVEDYVAAMRIQPSGMISVSH